VTIDREHWESIAVPELLTAKASRFERELGMDPASAYQAATSPNGPVFEEAIRRGSRANLAYRAIITAPVEVARAGVDVSGVAGEALLGILAAVEQGRVAKEAIPDLIGSMAAGNSLDEAIGSLGSSVTDDELARIIRRVIGERKEFVAQKKMAALGPLMGIVMQEVRGKVDGKAVSDALRRELERAG